MHIAITGCKSFAWRLLNCPLTRARPSPLGKGNVDFLRRRVCSQIFRIMEANAVGGQNTNMKLKPTKDSLRHLRTKENRKHGNVHGPSQVYVQVVGAGSRDNGPSLYVFSEYNRYLFNCGEGTQRLMQEHKLRAVRLDNIFLTRMNWEVVGGLSGMLLTLQSTGVLECILSGPPQLKMFYNAVKMFAGPLDDLKLSVNTYTDPDYKDDTMAVTQVPIHAQRNGQRARPSSSSSSSQQEELRQPENGEESCSERRPSGSAEDDRRTNDCGSVVVAYICKLNAKKGSFLVPKAKELGLPVGTAAIGPIISALKDGKSVTYEGKEIHPADVCGPSEMGPVFLVIDCPSEEFVSSLCTNPVIQRYQGEDTEDSVALVVHMTPEAVLKTEEYQCWMERFSSGTQHLVLNEQVCTTHNVGSFEVQTQLHLIHSDIFPKLRSYRPTETNADLRVPVVRAECLLKFQLRPKVEWQRDAIPSCDTEEFIKKAAEVPAFVQEVERSRKFQTAEPAVLSGQEQKYPEVVFLGTGSALPMKARNVSGTLVNISSSESMILDCGEGTFGQMCRHYGNDVDEVLTKLSTVFVSHLHADHHTGLIQLLLQRERALNTLQKPFTPLYVIGPSMLLSWLSQYHSHCQEILRHINFISAKFLTDTAEISNLKTKSLIQAVLKNNGLTKFQTCLVRHCKNAFACSLTHQSGWKLVFSGDTMPCGALAHIGENATLLIHEATLEDGMESEAADKKHSTTSQAIHMGMKMGAELIMLNHFSQRYAKIPLFSDDFNQRVGIAFDHMEIRPEDFQVLPQLLPPLKALFAVDIEEMEERREKRGVKKLRAESNVEGETCVPQRGNTKREQEELNQLRASKRLKAN